MKAARAAGLALGYGLDALLGDPRRGHPVAAWARAAHAIERRLYAPTRTRGGLFTAACVIPAVAFGALLDRATRTRPLLRVLTTAAATWTVLGARSLAHEGETMQALLDAGHLPAARQRLSHLCGRDATDLDAAELSRATVESLAENSADAIVAPLLWGAVAGIPGLLGHRAINTLDAMVGHRSARYERFGTASARLDDIACWVPARITARLACHAAPAVGGDERTAWLTLQRDGGNHPSPNGGRCEAAWAGALGVRLGGRNSYPGGVVETRGRLGDGRTPETSDIGRAVRLVRVVGAAGQGIAVLIAWGRG